MIECDSCGANTEFIALDDGSLMCSKCLSASHILDELGVCWCSPESEECGENQIWIHNDKQ